MNLQSMMRETFLPLGPVKPRLGACAAAVLPTASIDPLRNSLFIVGDGTDPDEIIEYIYPDGRKAYIAPGPTPADVERRVRGRFKAGLLELSR